MSVDDELKRIFSDPRAATAEGVIAAGGKMSPGLLRYAYEHGVFPWPHEGYPLLWFLPEERGVLDFSELHLPRSFRRWLKRQRNEYRITINTRFSEVLEACRAQPRAGQTGSWITPEIARNYELLHREGYAVSLEVMRDSLLVGGIYGVQSSRYFSCESMFHLEDNTSKLALYELILFLQACGQQWMDIQMVTPVSASFGGKLISKADFLDRIGC